METRKVKIAHKELSWYVDKLQRGEPFTSLLFGDGEFLAMSGERTGQVFTQYEEVVTPQLVEELLASLDAPGSDIIRGTDPHFIEPETYGGQDKEAIQNIAQRVQSVIGGRQIDWVDGVVWDTAVKTGSLGSFLKAIQKRPLIVVGNPKLCQAEFLRKAWFVSVPSQNAYADICRTENDLLASPNASDRPVVLVCIGLGAIPLILRVRWFFPHATFIDLGSVLDVFVGLGEQRGWRNELYQAPARLMEVIAKNLEGAV